MWSLNKDHREFMRAWGIKIIREIINVQYKKLSFFAVNTSQ